MTFNPDHIGDKDQRYEVIAYGWPTSGKCVVGWAEKLKGAVKLLRIASTAPGFQKGYVRDRKTGKAYHLRKKKIILRALEASQSGP